MPNYKHKSITGRKALISLKLIYSTKQMIHFKTKVEYYLQYEVKNNSI